MLGTQARLGKVHVTGYVNRAGLAMKQTMKKGPFKSKNDNKPLIRPCTCEARLCWSKFSMIPRDGISARVLL